MSYTSRNELVGKIDYEGGIYEALRYGIDSDDMPDDELRAAWQELVTAFDATEEKWKAVQALLPDSYEDSWNCS